MKNGSKKRTHRLGLIGLAMIAISLAALLPVAVSFAQTCLPPPSGLVSWWPGDGNANDIVAANHGTLQNGATFATGKVGQALSFDGVDDAVVIVDNANLRVSSFTLDAWINTADATLQQPIIAKAQASGNWLSYMLRLQDGNKLSLIVENRAENRYGHWRTLSTLSSNRWYHVAGTWKNVNGDNTDAKIYVDGIEQAIEMNLNNGYNSTFLPGYTTEPFFIGRDEVPSGLFKGLIDEAEIYDRVLSATEIQAIYNAGSAGMCKTGTISGSVLVGPSSLANVTVKLLDANGAVLGAFPSIQTDALGQYAFTNVPAPATYQVMIVEPLGYTVDLNPKIITLNTGSSATVNFVLTQAVIVNDARGIGYWKHQFDVYVTGRGNAQETSAQLTTYIASVHTHYTPHFSIFAGFNTLAQWQTLLSAPGSSGMYIKARRHLAALVLNLASLKLGQYTVATADGKTVGDVLTYASILLTDAAPANDALANTLAESVNNHVLIGAGIVPAGSVLYKGSPIEWEFSIPKEFALSQNYPNPFNPTTEIKFSVEQTDRATLHVYDILGQRVATLFDEVAEAGQYYKVRLDATNLATGMYLYRLQSGKRIELKKLLLLK